MSTLEQIEALGTLKRYRADLEAYELPNRIISTTPGFQNWLECDLPSEAPDRDEAMYPEEQVEQTLYAFVVGRPLAFGNTIRKLEPLGFHVWELKTHDVRIFGYFYRRSTFIAVSGAMRRDLSPARLYQPHVNGVRQFMATVDLDPPPSLAATRVSDVC